MKINSAYSPNEVNSRVGWDLNWYKWGSLSSLCYPVQLRAKSAETGGDNQGWDEVQPCHHAAVLWWEASCKVPTAALSVNYAGHLQASAMPGNPSSWSSQEKGFWMPGWQSGRRRGGSLEGWVVSSFVLFPCVSWQDIGTISHLWERLLWFQLPSSAWQSPLSCWGQSLWPRDWVEHCEMRKSRYKTKCFSPAHDGLVLVPRVSDVGTVLILPAVIKKIKLKIKGSYAVVRSRAAHLLGKAGAWEQTSAPSCRWDADSSVYPERF